MSLPRSINALRYSSAFGVFCSIYLCIAVTVIYWANRNLVPDPLQNFVDAEYFTVSLIGVISNLVFIQRNSDISPAHYLRLYVPG